MGKLGRDQFEHDPGRYRPGEQKPDGRIAPLHPAMDQRRHQKQRAGPEGEAGKQRVIAGRRAMRLLLPHQLQRKVVAERLFVKCT
ncbi:MAG: hypothetical protein ACRDRO_13385, partial [Pseudonocardiaceae bacterium]